MDAQQRRSVAGYAANIVFPTADGSLNALDRRHAVGLYRIAAAASTIVPDFTKRNMTPQDNRVMTTQDNRVMAVQDNRTMTVIEG